MLLADCEGEDYHNRLYGADGHVRLSDTDTLRFQALKYDTRYPDPVAAEFNQPTGPFGDPACFLRYIRERKVLTQLLYSYKINPQTLIFVGYSDTRDHENAVDLKQRDRTLFVKFGCAWIL